MKIGFIGNFEAEFSTENYHKKSFESLGHEVIPFQENRTSVSQILSRISDIDLLYWTHTHGFRVGSGYEILHMLNQFKEKSIPTVGYHLDLWLGLKRQVDLKTDPYWNIQHFFTVDKLMADWLNENTQTKGYFMPAGVYEGECFIGTPDRSKYPHDIIFTGSKGYHPEWPYRPKLIDWLHQTYGSRFGHYGGGGMPTIRGKELNNLYASAKIVIGDTLCINYNYPWYSSDRLFECCGRGAFLIYPEIEGLRTFYQPYKEVVYYEFGNFKQLKELIDYYLEHDFERETIRDAALDRTLKEHTYSHRIKELLTQLKLV